MTSAGRTKVGYTGNIDKRLEAIRAASAHPVKLVLAETGSIQLERAIHRVMDDRQVHHEWFEGEVDELEAREILDEAYVQPDVLLSRKTRRAKEKKIYRLMASHKAGDVEEAEQELIRVHRLYEYLSDEQKEWADKMFSALRHYCQHWEIPCGLDKEMELEPLPVGRKAVRPAETDEDGNLHPFGIPEQPVIPRPS